MTTFYINTSTDARNALALSLDDNTRQVLPIFFLGDTLPLKLYFTDGAGGYAEFDGEGELEVTLVIGELSTGALYALADTFDYDSATHCYSQSLVLSTEPMASVLEGLDNATFTLEISVTRINGDSMTLYQNSVEVRNQLISPTMGTIYEGGTYSDSEYIVHSSQNSAKFAENKIRVKKVGGSDIDDFADGDKIKFTEIGTGTSVKYFDITAVALVTGSSDTLDLTINSTLSEHYDDEDALEAVAGQASVYTTGVVGSGYTQTIATGTPVDITEGDPSQAICYVESWDSETDIYTIREQTSIATDISATPEVGDYVYVVGDYEKNGIYFEQDEVCKIILITSADNVQLERWNGEQAYQGNNFGGRVISWEVAILTEHTEQRTASTLEALPLEITIDTSNNTASPSIPSEADGDYTFTSDMENTFLRYKKDDLVNGKNVGSLRKTDYYSAWALFYWEDSNEYQTNWQWDYQGGEVGAVQPLHTEVVYEYGTEVTEAS